MSAILRPDFPNPPLSEADIVTADLRIDEEAVQRIAIHRAWHEHAACEKAGWIRDFDQLVDEEERRLRELATAIISTRSTARKATTAQQALIDYLELALEREERGLGKPRNPDAIKHYQRMLDYARAANPEAPEVRLANFLAERGSL